MNERLSTAGGYPESSSRTASRMWTRFSGLENVRLAPKRSAIWRYEPVPSQAPEMAMILTSGKIVAQLDNRLDPVTL